ncbi:MAG: cell division protein ZapA [bacterium]
MSNKEREVRIYGQVYRLKGEDPDRMDQVAEYLDRTMRDLLGDPAGGLSVKGAMLAALNITERWFEANEEDKKIITELNERADEILNLLPDRE